jgi:hypothetical protein
MKTVPFLSLAMGTLLSAFVFIGCKKTPGPEGPAGPQGPTGTGLSGTNGGYVTGTITGTRRDGTPFTEPFNYTYYFGGDSGTLDSTGSNMYTYNLARSVNDVFSSNYVNLSITATSKSATTGTINSFYFGFDKPLSGNKVFSFSANTWTTSTIATALAYNSSTGLFSGNFNINLSGMENNTGNPATINGSFQAALKEQVYIVKQQSAIKTD